MGVCLSKKDPTVSSMVVLDTGSLTQPIVKTIFLSNSASLISDKIIITPRDPKEKFLL